MKKVLQFFLVLPIGLGLLTNVFAAETYTIDPVHSEIGFAVKHLTVSTVKGNFKDYQGTVTFDPAQPAALAANVTIQAASINTWNEQRDTHLKTNEFLDVEKFPTLTFKSGGAKKEGDQYILSGDLTIRGVTKQVSIPLTIAGPVKSPFGTSVIGLSGDLTINRQDYGVSWNKALESGGFVVGNDVKISVNFEASKK